MAKTITSHNPDSKRWLIIGAYKAGASEKHVARISGLSTTAVRNIILNFQRTGRPCIPKKATPKQKQKLVVEYDADGNIIDSSDDEEEEEQDDDDVSTVISAAATKKLAKLKRKNKVLFKKAAKKKTPATTTIVTTKDIINYAMDQMRITENQFYYPSPPKNNAAPYPSPPHEHLKQEASNSISPNLFPSWPQVRENSPPQSPPSQQQRIVYQKTQLPAPSKFNQNIRGYEIWTPEDDLLLINHVVHQLYGSGWNELELKFNRKHSAKLCLERWKHLKRVLMKKMVKKNNTSFWYTE